jgi:hypothetical protein
MRSLFAAFGFTLCLVVATSVLADEFNPQVLPIQSEAYGKTYAEWNNVWWQWTLDQQSAGNPIFDETGVNAFNHQPDHHVFFLTGVLNVSGTATRHVTIPAGRPLFFPLLNTEFDNSGCIDAPPCLPTEGAPSLRQEAEDLANLATELHASIDGAPLRNLFHYKVFGAPSFEIDLPANGTPACTPGDVFPTGAPCGNIYQYQAFGRPNTGILPAVAAGYYLMLEPLPVGNHTINFGGTFGPVSNPIFTLDITYHLTVAP